MTATIQTPTVRVAVRRSRFWILAVVFLVLVAIVVITLTGAGRTAGDPYSATNAAPSGSRAIAQVLRQQGVDVTVTDSLTATRAALAASTPSTLMLIDPNNYLNDDQLSSVAALARHLVLLAPTYSQLTRLTPNVEQAGSVAAKPLTAGCSLEAARQAGTVTGTGRGYRDTAQDGSALTCFGSGHSTYSVVDVEHAGRTISVVGTTAAFTNEHVAEHGNAALALGLLGDNPHLVWYLPTIDDVAVAGKPTIAELTPLWVSPVIVLLIITAIAAAVWRGRRMGPLIVENLPVIVRASETMEGRARLYQRGAARLHALDALRLGAVTRLAAACGLSRRATTAEVVSAVSSVTRQDERNIRSLLLDDVPRNDRDLVALSDALLRLERAVSNAVHMHQQGE